MSSAHEHSMTWSTSALTDYPCSLCGIKNSPFDRLLHLGCYVPSFIIFPCLQLFSNHLLSFIFLSVTVFSNYCSAAEMVKLLILPWALAVLCIPRNSQSLFISHLLKCLLLLFNKGQGTRFVKKSVCLPCKC